MGDTDKVKIIITTPFSIFNYPSNLIKMFQKQIKTENDYLNYMYSTDRMNTKFNAFEHITVPSINAQTNKNYIWYVSHSPHLPEPYASKLKRIAATTPNMQLLPIDHYSQLLSAMEKVLPAEKFINVRLDDDDALHPDYFNILSSKYKPGEIISPRHGYKLMNYKHALKKGNAIAYTYPDKVCAASGLGAADMNIIKFGNHAKIHTKHKNITFLPQKGLFIRLINKNNFSRTKQRQKDAHLTFPFSMNNYINGTRKRKRTHKHTQSGGGSHPQFEEIGEGRSTSIYITPERKDVAVLLAFYNPANFKRIINNLNYIVQILKEKQIPVFVAECVFAGRKQQIPDADLVVHSKSFMFYKEQLLNKLEKVVPEKYTKLVMLDGDIIFDSPDWVDQISIALDTYDIIQPFDKACWLMPGNKIIRSWKYSFGHALTKGIPINEKNNSVYHPGFAWAFRRNTFRSLGGFYPNAIIGGGDMLFTFNFFQDTIPAYWYENFKNTMMTEAWPEYHATFKQIAPKLGCIDIRALHLFHGLTLNRQYKTRYQLVADNFTEKWDHYITYNDDNMTEFKDPKYHGLLLPYFKERNEDIPLKEAIDISQNRGTIITNQEPPVDPGQAHPV